MFQDINAAAVRLEANSVERLRAVEETVLIQTFSSAAVVEFFINLATKLLAAEGRCTI